MSLTEPLQRGAFAVDIKIDGDGDAARSFLTLFERLDIDWEEQLARFVGSTPAAQVIGLLRSSRAWRREFFENLRLNIAEYLQEESRDLPSSAEADRFYQEVVALRACQERLAARIERLNAALVASSSAKDQR